VSFRVRLALVAAAAVALAVILVSSVVFLLVRGELHEQVDQSLRERVREVSQLQLAVHRRPDGKFALGLPPPVLRGPDGYVQVVRANGNTLRPAEEDVAIPVDDRVHQVAIGHDKKFFTDAAVNGAHHRVLTFSYGPGTAVQVTRSLEEVDSALDRIRTFLFVIATGGIAIATALGLVVSRAAVAPVSRLTEATERVTETGDLSARIDARGEDELSRLAASFNTMLGALEQSTLQQRQLVADASHELRTPLTSLRTNFEVLMSEPDLAPEERRRLLHDVIEQIGEMTTLIAELIELAHGEQQAVEPEDVRLDLVAAEAVERIRRNRPGLVFSTDLEQTVVHGVPSALERAVGNLLDNAAKWSPPGGQVEIAVRPGEVTVRDHGPGIDDDDLPYVFDRFYRAPSARGMPGSGLGLAIVRQVAEAHGGGIVAESAEGGGTLMRLRLGPDSDLRERVDRSVQTEPAQSARS
jgi:two-component system sensor histidine kinase MprB